MLFRSKSVQWIPWALILALDIYQITANDWSAEDASKPEWLKWLDIGFDIMGLVFAGASAKVAKQIFAPFKNLGEKGSIKLAEFLEKNPTAKGIIEKIISGIEKVPKLLNNAIVYLKNKFPGGAEFIQKIIGGLSNILSRLSSMLSKLLGKPIQKLSTVGGKGAIGKGLRGGAMAAGIGYGAEKLAPAMVKKQDPYQEILSMGNKTKINPQKWNL